MGLSSDPERAVIVLLMIVFAQALILSYLLWVPRFHRWMMRREAARRAECANCNGRSRRPGSHSQ